jgi:hypothetical protein
MQSQDERPLSVGSTRQLSLYRFERFDDRRIKTLASGRLWLSSPTKFNDLEDCLLRIRAHDAGKQDVERLTVAAEALYGDSLNVVHNVSGFEPREILKLIERYKAGSKRGPESLLEGLGALGAEAMLRDHIMETTGVCSFFASAPTDALMWAHYADNHKGYCVEYSVERHPHPAELFEVDYVSKWPLDVEPIELLFCPAPTVVRILTTKRSTWSHEREYRLVRTLALEGDSAGNGCSVARPSWLMPMRVIGGMHLNRSPERVDGLIELASALGVPRARMNMEDAGLSVELV